MSADPGLQPQRTALAWSRTALAVLVNAVLVLRAGAHGGTAAHAPLLLAGWGLVAGAAALFACGRWRARQLLREGVPCAPSRRLMLFALAVAAAACVGGAAAVWLERPPPASAAFSRPARRRARRPGRVPPARA